jgi:hypothetical protein
MALVDLLEQLACGARAASVDQSEPRSGRHPVPGIRLRSSMTPAPCHSLEGPVAMLGKEQLRFTPSRRRSV